MFSLKWLFPGLGIKRWLIVFILGIVSIGLGLTFLLVQVYRTFDLPDWVYYFSLQPLPRVIRGLIFAALGAGLSLYSLRRLVETLQTALPVGSPKLVDVMVRTRQRNRGPRLVAIGGGTGLSSLLRGLKEQTSNISAIVTVADDGGSSGRLRRSLGVLPPGDFRQCIAALAEAEPLMTQLFEYRFADGDELRGHSFGNLFITALSAITGNFETALRESSRILAVRGQILPSTLEDVTLYAELADERLVDGESVIPHGGSPIEKVYLRPAWAKAYEESVRAIEEADAVLLGPGSLYTSVLPNLLVTGIAEALERTPAYVVYACNVATQPGESDGYTAYDHLEAILKHVPEGVVDCMLASERSFRMPEEWGVDSVSVPPGESTYKGIRVVGADMVDRDRLTRHNPPKLADAILHLLPKRNGRRNGRRS